MMKCTGIWRKNVLVGFWETRSEEHTSELQSHFHLSYPLFFNDTATTEIYSLSLHDALPISLSYAYKITHDEVYRDLAKKCFSWFLGNNTLGKPLYDEKTGGCFDGLHPDRVNLNQGAESLVSYLMSNLIVS